MTHHSTSAGGKSHQPRLATSTQGVPPSTRKNRKTHHPRSSHTNRLVPEDTSNNRISARLLRLPCPLFLCICCTCMSTCWYVCVCIFVNVCADVCIHLLTDGGTLRASPLRCSLMLCFGIAIFYINMVQCSLVLLLEIAL